MCVRIFLVCLIFWGIPSMANPEPVKKLTLSKEEWRKRLPEDVFHILWEEGTESAFSHPYDKLYDPGTYHCRGCDLPLFESTTKYDSKTGWPSFWDYIPGHLEFRTDYKLIFPRTEYHCARCGGHQGHVFNDGPEPTGKRYCNNGTGLKFVPKK